MTKEGSTSGDFLQPIGGWADPPTARLDPLPPSERSALFRLVSTASRFFGKDEIPDVFAVLARHPSLFWPWLLFASRLMPFGRLDAREREAVILRTAWNCRSRYEWGQHVELAARVGFTDADIVRVARGPAAFGDRHERALMQACDELFGEKRVSAATWSVLAEKHDARAMIEITLLVGHYEMLAGFLNSVGLRLEAPSESVLRGFLDRLATGPR